MRRGLPLAMGLLLLGSLALPAVDAAAKPKPAEDGLSRTATINVLFAVGIVAICVLAAAILFAWWSSRPPKRSPKRKTFASGRALGLKHRPRSVAEALRVIPRAHLGDVVEARELGPERVDVAILRRRSQTCDEVAGYLSGIFEAAWASDVTVAHPKCGGKLRRDACRFEVARKSGRPNRAAGRAAGASTRG